MTERSAPTRPDRPAAPVTDASAVAADLVLVAAFVLLGRTSHREGGAVTGYLSAAWPFLAGCLAGWIAVVLLRRLGRSLAGGSLATGAVVVAGTVVVGMSLRRLFTDGGTPVSFLVVATTFLVIFLLGWRAATLLVARRGGRA